MYCEALGPDMGVPGSCPGPTRGSVELQSHARTRPGSSGTGTGVPVGVICGCTGHPRVHNSLPRSNNELGSTSTLVTIKLYDTISLVITASLLPSFTFLPSFHALAEDLSGDFFVQKWGLVPRTYGHLSLEGL